MNPYIEQLNRELKEYQFKYGTERCESILEFLWRCYSASNPVDDGRVKAAESALRPVFEALPCEDSNTLFDLISELCIAYQRASFMEGILIGAQIASELAQ